MIFTASNDAEYHKKLMDGHLNAVHGDVVKKYQKLLAESIAVFHLVMQQGGLGKDGKVFTKKDARVLIERIQDTLKIPRSIMDVDEIPSKGVAGESSIENLTNVESAATPDTASQKQFVTEKSGQSPEQRKRDNRKSSKGNVGKR